MSVMKSKLQECSGLLQAVVVRSIFAWLFWCAVLIIVIVPRPPSPYALSHSTVKLDSTTFKQFIADRHVALVEFTQDKCDWCEVFHPVFTQAGSMLRDQHGARVLGQVVVNEEVDLARSFGVTYFPTLLYFQDGVKEEEHVLLPYSSKGEIVKSFNEHVQTWRDSVADPKASVIKSDATLSQDDLQHEPLPAWLPELVWFFVGRFPLLLNVVINFSLSNALIVVACVFWGVSSVLEEREEERSKAAGDLQEKLSTSTQERSDDQDTEMMPC